MEWTDKQAELIWRVVNDSHNNHSGRHIEMARQQGHRMLKRLGKAGFTIEFPDVIDYVIQTRTDGHHLFRMKNNAPEWIAMFGSLKHAEDMRDLLKNDLLPNNLEPRLEE